MGTLTSRAAQHGHAALAVQQRCQPIEIRRRGRHDCPGRQEARYLGDRGARCWLQGDVAGYHHYRHAAVGHGLPDCDLQRTRHLVGAGDQLAIVAALLEQRLRVGFLEIAGADLGRRYLCGDAEHGDPRAVAVEQAVDEMQITGPAAAGADGELTRQMRLGARRESCDLLVAHVDPLDLALAPQRVGQPVQAVADDAIDALDASGREGFGELICDGPHEFAFLSEGRRVERRRRPLHQGIIGRHRCARRWRGFRRSVRQGCASWHPPPRSRCRAALDDGHAQHSDDSAVARVDHLDRRAVARRYGDAPRDYAVGGSAPP